MSACDERKWHVAFLLAGSSTRCSDSAHEPGTMPYEPSGSRNRERLVSAEARSSGRPTLTSSNVR